MALLPQPQKTHSPLGISFREIAEHLLWDWGEWSSKGGLGVGWRPSSDLSEMMEEAGSPVNHMDDRLIYMVEEVIVAQQLFDPLAYKFAKYYYRNNGILESKRCPVQGERNQMRVRSYLETLVQAKVFPSTMGHTASFRQ